MPPAPRITAASWLTIAVLSFVWGGTFMVTEVALEGITPFWLAASRICLAALVMVGIWAGRGFALFDARPNAGQRAALMGVGLFASALPFTLLAWGQQHVTSAFAGVSMASTALIILPLAHVFVPGEALTLRRCAGFAVGFAGVVVLIGGAALDSTGSSSESLGRLACIAAAGCYACSSILMRRLPPVDAIGLATVLLLISSCYILPAAWIAEGPPPMPDGRTLAVLAFLGLIPTAAANYFRVRVVRTAGPVFMSLVNYQVPLWSVILGAAVLGEPLPPTLLWAMLLILAGLFISQWGALRRLLTRA